jgi:putative oxidoreductase
VSTHSDRPRSSGQGEGDFFFTPSQSSGGSGSTYNSSGQDPAHQFEDSAFDDEFDDQGVYHPGGATEKLPAGTSVGGRGGSGAYDPDGIDEGAFPPGGFDSGFDDAEGRSPARWHGGADFGLLILRLAVGGVAIAHGLQHVFGLFHGTGIHGLAQFLAAAGYSQTTILAWVTGVTELAGGALLVLGLFTSLGAAGILGVLANVVLMKWKLGFFAPGGYQLELIVGLAALALLFTGPGRAALDRPTPWFRHPVANGIVLLIIGLGASAAVWIVLHKPLTV